jgi:hypothetical protein
MKIKTLIGQTIEVFNPKKFKNLDELERRHLNNEVEFIFILVGKGATRDNLKYIDSKIRRHAPGRVLMVYENIGVITIVYSDRLLTNTERDNIRNELLKLQGNYN